MNEENRWLTVALVCMGALLFILYSVKISPAHDSGQWGNADPAIREWYQSLMQPDAPNASCCGEADAYWADKVFVKDGKTYAEITDDRPDAPLGRPHREVGTVFEIPNHKLKWDRGNPTGHAIIFVSRNDYVYCFVQAGGV